MPPLFYLFTSVLSQGGLSRRRGESSPRADGEDEIFPPPFLLEHRSQGVRRDGSFVPDARVSFSPDFGASGLLDAISPDDLVMLLLVLSRVTPSGGFMATPEMLAPALGISPAAMRQRLERLAAISWLGRALVTELRTESGLRLFAPARHLFAVESNVVIPIPDGGQAREVLSDDAPALPPSRRQEAVARSRELYARPRVQVEDEIERFLSGQSLYMESVTTGAQTISPLTPEQSESGARLEAQSQKSSQMSEGRRWLTLKKRLAEIGLSPTQATYLLDSYPFERIERQIGWLPLRDARSQVAYLLAAVAGDYAPPRSPANMGATPIYSDPDNDSE